MVNIEKRRARNRKYYWANREEYLRQRKVRYYSDTEFRERAARNAKISYERKKEPCPNCGRRKKVSSKLCSVCNGKSNKGAGNPNWKGGRFFASPDRILVYKPNHHRANGKGYVEEYILVWEQYHGKPLPNGWCIHHLNGIHHDNRPSNLEAMPNRKHNNILGAKSKRIQELEALLHNQGILV